MDTTFNEAKVGDILFSVWSWDDTRIPHFYRILKKGKASVKVQELEIEKEDPTANSQWCMVVPGEPMKDERPRTMRVNKWGWLNSGLDRKWGSPTHLWKGAALRHSMM